MRNSDLTNIAKQVESALRIYAGDRAKHIAMDLVLQEDLEFEDYRLKVCGDGRKVFVWEENGNGGRLSIYELIEEINITGS